MHWLGPWRQNFEDESWHGSGYAFLAESTFCVFLFCAKEKLPYFAFSLGSKLTFTKPKKTQLSPNMLPSWRLANQNSLMIIETPKRFQRVDES
jgi:hypothetical protein